VVQFPVFLPIGPYHVHPHPVFEGLGYFLGFQTFMLLRRRRGESLERGDRPFVVLAAVAGAIAGAKLLAWLEDPGYVWAHRGDVQTWLEGKTIVGALLGGLVGVEVCKRMLRIDRSTGDLFAIPLAVGIAVGRIGCFLTGLSDRTYGVATGWSWGVDFGDGVLRHPTQLYEMVFLAGVLIPVLWLAARRPMRSGDEFRLFMVGYLGWRLLVGFLQPDRYFIGMSAIQWACVAGLAYYARDVRRVARSLAKPSQNPSGRDRESPESVTP
jgi:prolipoprotein diacylglyceryltransferase